MKIKKVLNNNAALASDENGNEIIYTGCGICFQKRPGDELEESKIEKTFVMEKANEQFLKLVSELPYALVEKYNGWEGRELIEYFMNYCKAIFARYKGKVKYWLTFNEINVGTMPLGTVLSTGTIKGYSGPVTEVPNKPQ